MRKRTWIWLSLLTVGTLPLAVLLLATLEGCSSDDLLCFDPQAKALAGLLIVVWLIGSALIVLAASAKQKRKPEGLSQCPQCGSAVSGGSPTCLNCGYNLLASR